MKPARSRLRWRTIVGEAVVVAVATVAVVAVHLRLWRAAWREPWVRGGDADFYLMLARSLEKHGSYLHNSNLGWPFGQDLADLPHGSDNLHLLALRFFAVVTGGPASAVNVFFIATFAAVAFTSHLVLRKLGFSRFASGAGAFVYAFAPYHFLRGEGHLLLSGYEMVPIGVLLALMLFEEPLPLLRRRWSTWPRPSASANVVHRPGGDRFGLDRSVLLRVLDAVDRTGCRVSRAQRTATGAPSSRERSSWAWASSRLP